MENNNTYNKRELELHSLENFRALYYRHLDEIENSYFINMYGSTAKLAAKQHLEEQIAGLNKSIEALRKIVNILYSEEM